jgi:hypothetical protein
MVRRSLVLVSVTPSASGCAGGGRLAMRPPDSPGSGGDPADWAHVDRGPAGVLPVPEGDRRRSATVVVMLRQPGVEPAAARCAPAIGGVIAVAGAAGSGMASVRRAGAGWSQRLPGRCAEAGPGAAAPGLADGPGLAAAAGGGIGAVMGVDDPAGPGGDGGPLAAAPIETAHSGSDRDEPGAPQEAAGEPGPGTGRGDVAAAAGRRRRRARRARTSRGFPAMTARAFPPPGWQPPGYCRPG